MEISDFTGHDEEYEDEDNITNSNNNNNNTFSYNLIQNLKQENSQDNTVIGGNPRKNSNILIDNNLLIIQSLTSQFMETQGWMLYDKDGQFIHSYTSLEIFHYLTENVIKNNIRLDEYVIVPIKSNNNYKGDNFYLLLMDAIPEVLKERKNQYLNGVRDSYLYPILWQNNYFGNNNLNNINNFIPNFNQNILNMSNPINNTNNNNFNINNNSNIFNKT